MDHALENLGPERFQQFCQALLVKEFPDVTCLPVGQPDGGRDALREEGGVNNPALTIYQVKYSRSPPVGEAARKWLLDAVHGEVEKIKRLVERGAKKYVLITNVAGSAHLDTGTIDRLKSDVSALLPIPVTCWWRDDINRRLDGAWDLKLRYPEVMAGQDFLRLMLEKLGGSDKDRQRRAINTFLADQYEDDVDVKFKQVELQNKLLDLFVDLPFKIVMHVADGRILQSRTSSAHPLRVYSVSDNEYAIESQSDDSASGTAAFLLSDSDVDGLEQIVVEGAPGQGKSTLIQYLCQVHRIRWLNKRADLARLPEHHRETPLRIPFKVDLRDLSTWLSGFDPFADPNRPTRVTEPRSLEAFLARLVRLHSGGITFDVNDLHEVSKIAPLLIALDGLDEVADIKRRAEVVAAVTRSVPRLRENSSGVRVIITSRPAAFANSPGFNAEQFPHLELGSVTRAQILVYAEHWMDARNLSRRERLEFSSILNEKMGQPHLRDLARNPMQLAILLSLIHTRGTALPDKRTSLYDSYVDLFFSREAAKSVHVRKYIDVLKDIHRYIAWILHTAAESGKGNSGGRISQAELRSILQQYLQKEQHRTAVVDDVFDAMLERVVMIVSRVQGTYEFEVQPLREYFAARFLYDTASYSPTGGERGGTKPDRFDAISRNFYWLNVARFFCGCFSKGELLDLAERVKELMNDPKLGRTRHPALLGAMLLSDWVFSQAPRAVAEVASALSMPDMMRKLLPKLSRAPTEGIIQIPQVCGGSEIIAKAFDMLMDPNTRDDHSRALATFIIVNDRDAEQKRLDIWLGYAAKLLPKDPRTWFRAGRDLDTLELVGKSRLTAILSSCQVDAYTRRILWNEGRFDSIIHSENSAAEFINEYLKSPISYPYGDRVGRSPLYLLPVLFGYEAVFSLRRRYLHAPLMEAIRKFNAEVRGKEEDLRFSTDLERQAFQVSCQLSDILDEGGPPRPAPFENLVEDCRANWGDHPAIISLASTICHLSRRTGSGVGSGLFAENRSLCERIRFAKANAKNATWWRTNMRHMGSSIERFLFHLTFWTWTTTDLCLQMADEMGAQLDNLDESEWLTVLEFVGPTLERLQNTRHRLARPLLPHKLKSKRFALLLGLKDQRRYGRTIFLDYFSNVDDDSVVMAKFRQQHAFEAALADQLDWPSALAIIRSTYANGAYYSLSLFEFTRRSSAILDSISHHILDNAQEYPLALWAIAEDAANASARRSVRAVGQVAKEDHWFEE